MSTGELYALLSSKCSPVSRSDATFDISTFQIPTQVTTLYSRGSERGRSRGQALCELHTLPFAVSMNDSV